MFFIRLLPVLLLLACNNQPLAPVLVTNQKDTAFLMAINEKIGRLGHQGILNDTLRRYWEEKAALLKAHGHYTDWAKLNLKLYDSLFAYSEDFPDYNAHSYLDSIIQNRSLLQGDASAKRQLYLALYNRAYDNEVDDNFILAKDDYLPLLALADTIGFVSAKHERNVVSGLGNIYTRLGDYEKTIKWYEDHLPAALQKDSNYLLNASVYYDMMGLAYAEMNKYDNAIDLHKQALDLPGLDFKRKATPLVNLFDAFKDINQPDSMIAVTKRLKLLLDENQEHDYYLDYLSSWYEQQSAVAQYEGNDALALRQMEKAISEKRKFEDGKESGREIGKLFIYAAGYYADRKDFSRALLYAHKALRTAVESLNPDSLYALPTPEQVFAENLFMESMDLKARVFRHLYLEKKDTAWLHKALQCYELAMLTEDYLRKEYSYEQSKMALQKESRARSEQAINTALLLLQAGGGQAAVEKAFWFAEKSKAIVLSEAIHLAADTQRLNSANPLYQRIYQLKLNAAKAEAALHENKINSVEKEKRRSYLAQVQDDIQTAKQALKAKNLPYITNEQSEADFSLATIREQLIADTGALVEYFIGDTAAFVFYIPKKGNAALYKIAHPDSIRQQVGQFMGFFADRNKIVNDPGRYSEQAYALYQQLFPFTPDGITQLSLVPDDCLNKLPFEALLTKPATGNQLSQLPYLLQTQTVQYGFSARILLQQINNDKKNAGDYLYIAAPGFAQKERGLAALPASIKEAKAIDSVTGHAELVQADAATAQDFLTRAGGYRILHLSTHARGGDSIAPPQIEFTDTSLSLSALYAMQLKAKLVVLSACETNLGALQKGEGPMSLSRGFSYAGAQTMIASLWAVDDAASANLFGDFYQQLRQHSIATSLREAKRKLLSGEHSGMASPYYWAGFQFIGQDAVVEQPVYLRWGWAIAALVLLFGSAIWWRYRKRRS